MGKLYLFGIGGTGSRVIRSLTMLLASGVDPGVDRIIPVLIDPDLSNGDLTRTVNLLKKYKEIRSELSFGTDNQSQYFKTEIDDQGTDFRLPIANVGNKTFGQYVEYDSLSREDKAMMSLLFSDKNLNAQMQEGFKGNPNMGSIVLNDFCDPNNNVLSDLLSNFENGDKIFIISSIFGGTGAAGFPLLLKTFRQAQQFNSFANPAVIADAPIGALSVLPYFGLQADCESEINMATFVTKAKSALTYYQDNLDTDALYYIADSMTSSYDNVEGSDGQKNDAHFIELASALAVVDFAKETRLSASHNLVIFHLMGQHMDPGKRYPHTKEFEKFTSRDIRGDKPYLTDSKRQFIAEYDNATRYNDYVLKHIIDLFRDKNTVLVYFSDHGEEVYDYRDSYGRVDFDNQHIKEGVKYQYEVPFMIWCSNPFMEKNPQIIHDIKRALHRPFKTDEICQILFHLAQLKTAYYRKKQDLLSPDYLPYERVLGNGINYDRVR